MSAIKDVLRLPEQITAFEASYLERVNRIAMWFFAGHVPAFVAVAYFNDTGPLTALVLTLAALFGPLVAMKTFENPRHVSMMHGFTSMLMGGLLVHFGQGPVQIEMHFYFFALLAMLAIFANPMVVVVAAGTVAVHHLALWYFLPQSVFNYDAPLWVVLVHAAFVVLESVATVSIARSFFDNVVGLERIVQQRTQELDVKNRQMRLVLDNVDQGLLTVDRAGCIAEQRSSVVDQWLGACGSQSSLVDCLSRVDARTAEAFDAGYEQLLMGFLPIDVSIDQLPTQMAFDDRHFGISYTPIMDEDEEELEQLLVVMTDRTSIVAREQLEREQKETTTLLHRFTKDQGGFEEFFEEAALLVRAITERLCDDLPLLKRTVHTLKGNAMLFDVTTVARLCEAMEDEISTTGRAPDEALVGELEQRWSRLRDSLRVVLEGRDRDAIVLRDDEYRSLLRLALREPSHAALADMLMALRLEDSHERLARVAAQAQIMAIRLDKGAIDVRIDASGHKLEPHRWASFWRDFVHVVRNAVDHGLETTREREERGKSGTPTLTLSTHVRGSEFVVSIEDDGRGIDWDRVRAKAKACGLPHATEADLEAALFSDGMSTRDDVTAFSGRGVGLGAVRSACEERGGHIRVWSRLGHGTRFDFVFPVDQMAPRPQEMLAA